MSPRFRVNEKRSYTSTVIIDAENKTAASRYEGEIVTEFDDSSWNATGEELISCEEIGPEEEE